MRSLAGILLLLTIPVSEPLSAQNLRDEEFLAEAKKGFEHIYNLEYDQAVTVFENLKRKYPQHPAPPLHRAVVIWLHELFERQELDLDRFISPSYFAEPTEKKMSAGQRQAFFDHVVESQKISEAILQEHPQNQDARYFLGSAHGILGAFAITIDRSVREAFSQGKKAYKYHKDLVQENPRYYDAYLSVGTYEYIVDNLPWYLKWIAVLVGYSGSQEKGFEYLKMAAEQGQFVPDDARVLLMVLYVRENRHQDALQLARHLHSQYPKNFIIHLNQAQIVEKTGEWEQAVKQYQEILNRAEAGTPNYQKMHLETFYFQIGRKFLQLGQPQLALDQFEKSILNSKTPQKEKALSHLAAGQALDLLNKRQQAKEHYRQVLNFPDVEDSHDQAEDYLDDPFKGD